MSNDPTYEDFGFDSLNESGDPEDDAQRYSIQLEDRLYAEEIIREEGEKKSIEMSDLEVLERDKVFEEEMRLEDQERTPRLSLENALYEVRHYWVGLQRDDQDIVVFDCRVDQLSKDKRYVQLYSYSQDRWFRERRIPYRANLTPVLFSSEYYWRAIDAYGDYLNLLYWGETIDDPDGDGYKDLPPTAFASHEDIELAKKLAHWDIRCNRYPS